jgi:hypothetical protein
VPGKPNLPAELNRANFQQEVAVMNALRFHENVITLLGIVINNCCMMENILLLFIIFFFLVSEHTEFLSHWLFC